VASAPPPRRLEPCNCGSGRRYKDCHGAVKPDPLLARATTLREAGDYAAAQLAVEEALHAAPGDAVAWNAQGVLRLDLLDAANAIRSFDEALERAPQYCDAHYNRAIAHLLLGDYAQGWPEYEWRTRVPGYTDYAHYPFGMPRWKGEPLRSRRILVHAEQGNGDTIQFARFLALLAAEGAQVDVFCQAPLASLMERVPGVNRAFSNLDQRPTHDFHAPLLDIAAHYLPDVGAPHWHGPYVTPLPERVQRFAREFETVRRPRIGIAWQGSALNTADRLRSVAPEAAAALVTGDAAFFSLQVGAPPLALAPGSITDLAPLIHDWEDTAALMSHLDLVVAVDSAIVHLAGAMGKPVWVLVRFNADWRWELEGEKTRWYPSMRIFRQRTPGDWRPVLERVRAAYISSVATSGR
jgi:SEC-C motif-containing protein/glycosyl transferase family 9 (putative heptosyltransferase)/tetratricopeptide repeat protein